MNIDWFTVAAQAINFLILIWLMKRFLYKPIINAIDTREKSIAKELADADAKKSRAQREHDEFQQKNDEFDKQRAAMLSRATDEIKVEQLRLLDEARKAADILSAKRLEKLSSDADQLNKAISRQTQKEVFAIARKALTDLSSISLEDRISKVFADRIRELDGKAKENLAEAIKSASAPAILRSAFDLLQEQRTTIQKAINETFSTEIELQFETSADLISGIELTTNGYKLEWSIAGYLESLEKGMQELLGKKDKHEEKVESTERKPEINDEGQ